MMINIYFFTLSEVKSRTT